MASVIVTSVIVTSVIVTSVIVTSVIVTSVIVTSVIVTSVIVTSVIVTSVIVTSVIVQLVFPVVVTSRECSLLSHSENVAGDRTPGRSVNRSDLGHHTQDPWLLYLVSRYSARKVSISVSVVLALLKTADGPVGRGHCRPCSVRASASRVVDSS